MPIRPFIDTLRHVEGGQLLDELAEQQQAIIQAVQHTHKKGVLTITLNYTPEGAGAQVSIEADIKAKTPMLSGYILTQFEHLRYMEAEEES
jgi:hypothetical protein